MLQLANVPLIYHSLITEMNSDKPLQLLTVRKAVLYVTSWSIAEVNLKLEVNEY